MTNRSAGIFLHLTSLPGNFGVGDLGYEARKFVDLLYENSVKIWQICPICPTAFGNSPYSTPCALAGNPLLISLEILRDWGYLRNGDLEDFPKFSTKTVEFDEVIEAKNKLFQKAFENFTPSYDYENFCKEENYWLNPYVLFLSLSKKFGTPNWSEWDKFAKYDKKMLEKYAEENKKELDYHRFIQFIFHSQWFDLKKYANTHNIRIFGDVPYYVSYESSDVWSNQSIFELDKDGKMLRVGGVPPDYFSEDGQLWGTPLYRWEKIKKTGYEWWLNRIKLAFFYNDIVRIDHFRAFESFWTVEGDAKTAKVGVWEKGPCNDFFKVIREKLGDKIELIAEDLGVITEEVNKLRDSENLCGMKIFQFAFDGNRDNYYLPYNCTQKSVMYSGTHDNDTILGWYRGLDEGTKKLVKDYIGETSNDEHKILKKITREVLASVSVYAVMQLPDLLGLGSEARFNIPGIVGDKNWAWRFEWNNIEQKTFSELKELIQIFGR